MVEFATKSTKKWIEIQSQIPDGALLGLKCVKKASVIFGTDWENMKSSFDLKFVCRKGDYEQPNLSGLDVVLQDFMAESLQNAKVGEDDMKYLTSLAETSALFATFVSPTVPIESQLFKASCCLQFAAWLHDDGVDQLDFFESAQEKYENVILCNELIRKIMRGETMDLHKYERLKFLRKVFMFDRFIQFYNILLKEIRNFSTVNVYFLASWDKYLEAQEWTAYEATLTCELKLLRDTYIVRSAGSTGGPFVLDLSFLLQGLVPTEGFYNSIIIDKLLQLYRFIAMASNCLWSLHKDFVNEIYNGENNLLMLTWRQCGGSLQTAVENLVHEINTNIDELLKLEELLNQMYSGKYRQDIIVVKQIINGNLFFQLSCPRYSGSDIQFEIVTK